MSTPGFNVLYTLLSSFTNLKQSKTATAILAIVGAALGYTGTELLPQEPAVKVSISAGRQQILESGLAGKPTELNRRLSETVERYFSDKGYPCDPITESKIVGETIERAKSCGSAAPAPAPTPTPSAPK